MKLAIFDDYRLGLVSTDERTIVDVSSALPWPHDPDPLGAGWWVRVCRDFDALREPLAAAARSGQPRPLDGVRLRAPVLNPTKIVAAASNYAAHREEMRTVSARTGGGSAQQGWLSEFDVFLKAPSSIIGPGETCLLPAQPVEQHKEIHHESELALVIGTGGAGIAEADALRHVLGYTIGLDMTVRGAGDRSRRKSYDTFTPVGPWIATADEVGDPHALEIRLAVNGEVRQQVSSGDMSTRIPGIIAYASSVMRLEPGDVVLTGAPPGVNQVHDGDVMEAAISRVGSMRIPVRLAAAAR
jgi:2-keto-4-pentenoate hydratase/2-oxohepta-3-ene-1,7-dioic acid hydratase in catechol pathway